MTNAERLKHHRDLGNSKRSAVAVNRSFDFETVNKSFNVYKKSLFVQGQYSPSRNTTTRDSKASYFNASGSTEDGLLL